MTALSRKLAIERYEHIRKRRNGCEEDAYLSGAVRLVIGIIAAALMVGLAVAGYWHGASAAAVVSAGTFIVHVLAARRLRALDSELERAALELDDESLR